MVDLRQHTSHRYHNGDEQHHISVENQFPFKKVNVLSIPASVFDKSDTPKRYWFKPDQWNSQIFYAPGSFEVLVDRSCFLKPLALSSRSGDIVEDADQSVSESV